MHQQTGDKLTWYHSYKLAEKLQDRLNELNKDLTEMIEEVNSTSQTLSKTGKPDDPVSSSALTLIHTTLY